MKRFVYLILVLSIISTLLLPGCQTATPAPTQAPADEPTTAPVEEPGEDVTLEFWSMWNEGEPQAELLQEYAEGFEAETGIKVNITFSSREVQTNLRTALQAGQKVDLMDADGAPLAGGMAAEGLGYPLNDWLDEDAWGESGRAFRDIFMPGQLEFFARDGNIYQVPHTLITAAFWYDKRDFRDAGVDSPPKTWDEMLDVCEKIKQNDVACFAQDGGVSFYNIYWFYYLIARLKGPGFLRAAAEDLTGNLWDDPAFVRAIEMERELVENGYIIEGFEGFTWPEGQQTLATDESAMELCGSWLPNELKTQVDPEFEWGGFPFPEFVVGEGEPTENTAIQLTYMVLKDAPHPKEAFDFIRYALSKENQEAWVEQTLSGVPRKDVEWPPILSDAKAILDNATVLFDDIDGVGTLHPEYSGNVLQPTHDDAFFGNISPEEFAATMKELTIQYWETHEAPADAGEAPPPEEPEEPVTLEFWSMWNEGEPQAVLLQEYADGFEAETGHKVNITFSSREVQTNLRTALQAGQKVDLMDADGAPLAGGMAAEGLGYPLNDWLDEDAWGESGRAFRDVFMPGQLEFFAKDGTIYQVPHTLITAAFWYDKRDFRDAGVESPPKTWDELLDVCEKIKQNGVACFAQDGGVSFYNIYWFYYLIARLKGPGFLLQAAEDPTGALWDDPAFVRAIEMERELVENGYIIEGFEGFTWPEGQQTLTTEESAMELCGSWLPNELKTQVDPEFEWGGFPFPEVAGGEGERTENTAIQLTYMVLKDAPHPKVAFDFIRYCMSKENQEAWVEQTLSGVPRKDVEWPPILSDAKAILDNATVLFDDIDGVGTLHPEYSGNVLQPTHDDAFFGSITPEEFAATMKELTITYWETH